MWLKFLFYCSLTLVPLSCFAELLTLTPLTHNPIQIEVPTVPLRPFADQIERRLQNNAPRIANIPLKQSKPLIRLYHNRLYQALWTQSDQLNTVGQTLFNALQNVASHGISPQRYPLDILQKLAQTDPFPRLELELLLSHTYLRYSKDVHRGVLQPNKLHRNWYIYPTDHWDAVTALQWAMLDDKIVDFIQQLPPPHSAYRYLQHALRVYRQQAQMSTWQTLPAGKKLQQGNHHQQVALLRQRLQFSGDYANSSTAYQSKPLQFEAALAEAVTFFQHRHGLQTDGVVGPNTRKTLNVSMAERIAQLEINLERWRWMPRELPSHYIDVNIPDFQLHVRKAGKVVSEMPVIVGKKSRKTPVFTEDMRYLVMNPRWSVPYNIAVKDILPKLQNNPEYLIRSNMRVFEEGELVDTSAIDWSQYDRKNFPFRIRQNPGRRNALGRIKFMFPNRYSVYLHDTPKRYLFKRTTRAFSSGCIRVSDPVGLANYLLSDDKNWSQKKIKHTIQGKNYRSKVVNLPANLPVYLWYWTAWVDSAGVVHFRDDIYGYDRVVQRALKRAARS